MAAMRPQVTRQLLKAAGNVRPCLLTFVPAAPVIRSAHTQPLSAAWAARLLRSPLWTPRGSVASSAAASSAGTARWHRRQQFTDSTQQSATRQAVADSVAAADSKDQGKDTTIGVSDPAIVTSASTEAGSSAESNAVVDTPAASADADAADVHVDGGVDDGEEAHAGASEGAADDDSADLEWPHWWGSASETAPEEAYRRLVDSCRLAVETVYAEGGVTVGAYAEAAGEEGAALAFFRGFAMAARLAMPPWWNERHDAAVTAMADAKGEYCVRLARSEDELASRWGYAEVEVMTELGTMALHAGVERADVKAVWGEANTRQLELPEVPQGPMIRADEEPGDWWGLSSASRPYEAYRRLIDASRLRSDIAYTKRQEFVGLYEEVAKEQRVMGGENELDDIDVEDPDGGRAEEVGDGLDDELDRGAAVEEAGPPSAEGELEGGLADGVGKPTRIVGDCEDGEARSTAAAGSKASDPEHPVLVGLGDAAPVKGVNGGDGPLDCGNSASADVRGDPAPDGSTGAAEESARDGADDAVDAFEPEGIRSSEAAGQLEQLLEILKEKKRMPLWWDEAHEERMWRVALDKGGSSYLRHSVESDDMTKIHGAGGNKVRALAEEFDTDMVARDRQDAEFIPDWRDLMKPEVKKEAE